MIHDFEACFINSFTDETSMPGKKQGWATRAKNEEKRNRFGLANIDDKWAIRLQTLILIINGPEGCSADITSRWKGSRYYVSSPEGSLIR